MGHAPGTIVGDRNLALYDAPLWTRALIASRLHWVWIAIVCGKIKTDFRYSNTLGWNIFPVPVSRFSTPLAQRGVGVLDASNTALRGTGDRHRQGYRCRRRLSASPSGFSGGRGGGQGGALRPRGFAQMSSAERLRACLQHADVKHENGQWMINASLRKRLGIHHASQASVIIRQARDAGLIRPADPRHPWTGYLPFLA